MGYLASLLRVVFQVWQMVILQMNQAALQSEVTSLRTQTNRPKSIWNMSKAELIDKAYEELGMSRAQAEAKTVTILREMIRRNRELARVQVDPMAVMPKGLGQLKFDALKEVMAQRNLPLGDRVTRATMIVAITEHVQACQLLASSPDPHSLPQQEWEEVESMDTDMPQPKAKAKSKGMRVSQSASSR